METMAEKRMFAAAQHVRGKVLETLSGARSGREYTVPGTSVTYTASAPGEPPAVQTSQLRESIDSVVISDKKYTEGRVGTTLDRGIMLEFGTINMLPRPWLKVSFDATKERVKNILSARWW